MYANGGVCRTFPVVLVGSQTLFSLREAVVSIVVAVLLLASHERGRYIDSFQSSISLRAAMLISSYAAFTLLTLVRTHVVSYHMYDVRRTQKYPNPKTRCYDDVLCLNIFLLRTTARRLKSCDGCRLWMH